MAGEIGARLRDALEEWHANQGGSGNAVKKFSEALGKDVTGSSYGSIHNYLGGKEPPLEFISAAARELEVREPWLAFGDGYRTEEEQQAAEKRRAEERRAGDLDIAAIENSQYLAEMELIAIDAALQETWREVRGPDAPHNREAMHQRDAVLRYSRKLDDAWFPDAPWADRGDKYDMLKDAAAFLVRTEAAFRKAPEAARERGSVGGVYLESSAAAGWRVTWYDAVLDLFARRVYGLGERSGYWDDVHAPAAGRRAQVSAPEEQPEEE